MKFNKILLATIAGVMLAATTAGAHKCAMPNKDEKACMDEHGDFKDGKCFQKMDPDACKKAGGTPVMWKHMKNMK